MMLDINKNNNHKIMMFKHCPRIFIIIIILLSCVGSIIIAQDNMVDLTINNVNEELGNFDITYDTNYDIYNFQLSIEGVTLIDVESDYFPIIDFTPTGDISGLNENEILNPAIAGQGILLSLTYQLNSEPANLCIVESSIGGLESTESQSTQICYSISGGDGLVLSFGEIDLINRTLEIQYASYVDIHGFQLDIEGVYFSDASMIFSKFFM